MRRRHRWISIEAVLLIAMTFSWRSPASAAEPLFGGDDVLDLTIHGPMTSLARGTPDSTPVTGRLELANGETIPMTFSTYGISRLRECGTPCLKSLIGQPH